MQFDLKGKGYHLKAFGIAIQNELIQASKGLLKTQTPCRHLNLADLVKL